MPYLISILIAGLFFFGFLLLTWYERKRGVRFFPGIRYRLDIKVARLTFLVEHVDWGAFTAHLARTTFHTLAHDLAHATLLFVRAVERFLTRAVGALRHRRDQVALPRLEHSVEHFRESLRRDRSRMHDMLRRQAGE